MFYGRPFRLGKKRARRSGKPRGGKKPQRLIWDKAYDSDEFREELKKEGIELVALHTRGTFLMNAKDLVKLSEAEREELVKTLYIHKSEGSEAGGLQ